MEEADIGGELIDLNGTRLHVEVVGDDDATAVVYLHGFSLDSRMWDGQVSAFAKHFRVVRYDLRGFGSSNVPDVDTVYRHSDDAIAVLDALDIDRAVIVGLSMGGAVALDVALAHPGRVQALVLAASILPGFETPGFDARVRPIWRAGRNEGVQTARQMWLENELFATSNDHPATRERLRAMVGDYSGWHWSNRDPGVWATADIRAELDRITTTSTLVVVGQRDIEEMRLAAEELHREIPNARLTVMPGLGHLPNMEDAAAFNASVIDFLAGVQSS